MEAALLSMRTKMEQLDSGELSLDAKRLSLMTPGQQQMHIAKVAKEARKKSAPGQ